MAAVSTVVDGAAAVLGAAAEVSAVLVGVVRAVAEPAGDGSLKINF